MIKSVQSEKSNIEVRLLDSAERETLRPTYEQEFNSELPTEQQANILGVIEDGEIKAFITTEVLLRVGLLWVSPTSTTPSTHIKEMIRHLIVNIPKGSSVVGIATEPIQGRLFENLGFYECEGTLYRTDV